jgi:SAM-dependent methyltransferase
MVSKTRVGRTWEVWDAPGVAQQVDNYWRQSPNEVARRRDIATLVRSRWQVGQTLLEVGCGSGMVYEALRAAMGKQLNYLGVDNSLAMLAIAKGRFPRARFRTADAFALPFADAEFDLAVAFEVFGHMPDCSQAVAELVRVGKGAIFTAWVHDGPRLQDGGEHYVYPLSWLYGFVGQALKGRGDFGVKTVPLGPTVAFIVERKP